MDWPFIFTHSCWLSSSFSYIIRDCCCKRWCLSWSAPLAWRLWWFIISWHPTLVWKFLFVVTLNLANATSHFHTVPTQSSYFFWAFMGIFPPIQARSTGPYFNRWRCECKINARPKSRPFHWWNGISVCLQIVILFVQRINVIFGSFTNKRDTSNNMSTWNPCQIPLPTCTGPTSKLTVITSPK